MPGYRGASGSSWLPSRRPSYDLDLLREQRLHCICTVGGPRQRERGAPGGATQRQRTGALSPFRVVEFLDFTLSSSLPSPAAPFARTGTVALPWLRSGAALRCGSRISYSEYVYIELRVLLSTCRASRMPCCRLAEHSMWQPFCVLAGFEGCGALTLLRSQLRSQRQMSRLRRSRRQYRRKMTITTI